MESSAPATKGLIRLPGRMGGAVSPGGKRYPGLPRVTRAPKKQADNRAGKNGVGAEGRR